MKHEILALLVSLALIICLALFMHYFPQMSLAEAFDAFFAM